MTLSIFDSAQRLLRRALSTQAMLSLDSLQERVASYCEERAFILFHEETITRWRRLTTSLEGLCSRLGWRAPTQGDIDALGSSSDELRALEPRLFLCAPDDHKSALILLRPQDKGSRGDHEWCASLGGMYRLYAERAGYQHRGFLPRDADGVPLDQRIYAIEVQGLFAYGSLRFEAGLHRGKRGQAKYRSTIAQVEVSPMGGEPIELSQVQLQVVPGRFIKARVRPRTSGRGYKRGRSERKKRANRHCLWLM